MSFHGGAAAEYLGAVAGCQCLQKTNVFEIPNSRPGLTGVVLIVCIRDDASRGGGCSGISGRRERRCTVILWYRRHT